MLQPLYLLAHIPVLLHNQNGFSFFYLLYLFNIPISSYIRKRKSKRFQLIYSLILFLSSMSLLIAQSVTVIRGLGERNSNLFSSLFLIIAFFYPTLLTISNIFELYLLYRKFTETNPDISQSPNQPINLDHGSWEIFNLLSTQGVKDLLSIFLTGIVAISHPSIFNCIYLLVFFYRCFSWRTRKVFTKTAKLVYYSVVCTVVSTHLILIFLCREIITAENLNNKWLRIFGLSFAGSEHSFKSLPYWTEFIFPMVSIIVMFYMYSNYLKDIISQKPLLIYNINEPWNRNENIEECLTINDEIRESHKKFINTEHYLFRYFSKFSLQLSIIGTCSTVIFQSNFTSILYIFLMTLHKMFRKVNKRTASFLYLCVLIIILTLEYSLHIFRLQISNETLSKVFTKSNSLIFISDIFQLILVSYHYQIMKYKSEKSKTRIQRGVEEEIGNDYISQRMTYYDVWKYIIYLWFHWVSASFIFITGLINFNLMGVAYLLFSFIFLLNFTKITRKYKIWFKSWNFMWYCSMVFVIMKILPKIYQIYIKNECISCENSSSNLAFDVVCLVLITLQIKIFKSKSFWYVTLHFHVQKSLESKGTQIIHSRLMRRIKYMISLENLVKEKLEMKNEKIKNIQKECNYPPVNHFNKFLRSANFYGHLLDPADDEEDIMEILNYQNINNDLFEVFDENFMEQPEAENQREENHITESESENCNILSRMSIYISDKIDAMTDEHNRVNRILNSAKLVEKNIIINDINENHIETIFRDLQTISSKMLESPPKPPKRFYSVLQSISGFLLANFDYLCYFWIILNCGLSSNILMTPFPFIILLWAIHSVPRPSKKLWIIIKYYTMFTIMVKFFCQWTPINLNKQAQLVLGFHKSNDYAILDSIQLLLTFLNCEYLKYIGQWGKHKCSGDPAVEGQRTNESFIDKFKRILRKVGEPKNQLRTNVYTYTFICELISIVIILADYKSFVPTYTNSAKFNFFTEKVAMPLLAMMIVQFSVIMFDRYLLLRRSIKIKFVFQIIYLFVIHIWLTICLQSITHKNLRNLIGPIFLYVFKYIYFILSAFQIKYGYPVVRTRNFLTWHYNSFCFTCYFLYVKIPFLNYFRMCFDWIFTDSSLCLTTFNYVESLFIDIYNISYWRNFEIQNIRERGSKCNISSKIFKGISILLLIICIIWIPSVTKAIIDSTMDSHPISQCHISLSIGDLKPIFKYTTNKLDLKNLPKSIIENFPNCFHGDLESKNYLKNFQEGDITEVGINKLLSNYWNSVPDSLEKLESFIKKSDFKMRLDFKIECEKSEVDNSAKKILYEKRLDLSNKERELLYEIIFEKNKGEIRLNNLFPKFLTAYKKSLVQTEIMSDQYEEIYLKLVSKKNADQRFWEIGRTNEKKNQFCPPEINLPNRENILSFIIFNEQVTYSKIGQYINSLSIPIIGIYMFYIFGMSKLLHGCFYKQYLGIYYQEMADPKRINNIINEVYLARENKLYEYEEQCVAKLYYIFQSPEILLKWTSEKRSVLEKYSKKNL